MYEVSDSVAGQNHEGIQHECLVYISTDKQVFSMQF